MNNISPEDIADLMYHQFDYFSQPKSLSSTIVAFAAKIVTGISDLDLVTNILEHNLQKYISSIVRKEQERKKLGLFCPYETFPDNDEIVGFSYPRSNDSAIMTKIRRLAPEVSTVLDTIRKLSPQEFEQFCSRVLDLLKAAETYKTKDSNDEGIDFLGWLCIPEYFANIEAIFQFHKDFRMLVLGQAKRYKPDNPVGVSHIRELVGTVSAFHHDQLAPWESKLKINSFTLMSPVLPLIMTTGRISPPAKELARKCGVVTRDGAEIAQFLCLEGIGMVQVDEKGLSRLRFDERKFFEWLHQSKT
jgi:restriction endonuclease Mrr